MMSNLPLDLVEEILSRVPATSLKRLRSTCKSWNNCYKDQRFTEKHSVIAAKQFLILMLKDCRVSSVSVNLNEIHNNIAAPSIELKGVVGPQKQVSEIFHCDGLLLCTTKDDRLEVWNPCTGQTRRVQHSIHYKTNSEFVLGYVNNKSRHSYKILRYWNFYMSNYRVSEFEIYDFSSDSWRFIDEVNPYCLTEGEVSLKGNTYWLASDEKRDIDLILRFDFSIERYQRLNLPILKSDYETEALSVVREKQLSVLLKRNDTLEREIWVTTNDKIDHTTKNLLWIKFLAIDQRTCYHWSCVSFFIDEEKKMAVFCDGYIGGINETSRRMFYIIGEDKYYRELYVGDSPIRSHRPFVFNYVPSLVQIPQATVIPKRRRRKRKNRN